MRIHVLGSAAGGGFPQWNCNCPNCLGLRRGELKARSRTQSSIAVSDDGEDWVVINTSPDVRAQILDFEALQPGRGARDTGIRAVLLTDAQIDHASGLVMLREGEPLPLYTTEPVREDLSSGFPVLKLLEHYCGVDWHPVPSAGEAFGIEGLEGLEFRAVPLESKAPPYSPHRQDPQPGDNIGLWITDRASGRSVFYAPGLGAVTPEIEQPLLEADCLLVDGSFWTEDEMLQRGVGRKRAAEMGHLPQSGPGGMLEWLERARAERKVLIHINNTNPILDEDSPERAQLDRQGVEVAYDGMELTL